jgi:hypothetical protein
MRLSLYAGGYNLRIEPAKKQSDPPNVKSIAETTGQVSNERGQLHHYAITINNGVAFFHVDGKLMDSYNLAADFWTYPRGYAGASFEAGDLPIMMKAVVHYGFVEEEVIAWLTASYTMGDGSGGIGYVPYYSYNLTQIIPGSPPAAIQSMRFTPKPLFTNQNFVPPATITALR